MTTDTNNAPPENEIRSDLWPTMSASQLYQQQALILDKIVKLRSMSPFGVAPTSGVQALHSALQQALKDVTGLIDNKTSQPTKRTPDGK